MFRAYTGLDSTGRGTRKPLATGSMPQFLCLVLSSTWASPGARDGGRGAAVHPAAVQLPSTLPLSAVLLSSCRPAAAQLPPSCRPAAAQLPLSALLLPPTRVA